MKKIKLLRLEMQNFKCFKEKVVEFNNKKTLICGPNGVGKSTVYDAVLWLLFDKTASGASATSVRPHDKEGNDIDFLEISVAATFDVDGREIALKKTQKQNWVKDRSTQQQTFKGNDNYFEVNGIPKKLKDYKQYVTDEFCPEEVFLSCTNAQSFFKLDAKKRRGKLMDLVSKLTDHDVISINPEFAVLSDQLRDGTVEEIIARSKTAINRLKEKLSEIPARIDEKNKERIDIDIAELELEKNAAYEELKEVDEKIDDISKQYAELQKASDGILEIKFAISEMERSANAELIKKKREISDEISDLKVKLHTGEGSIRSTESLIKYGENNVLQYKAEINKLAESWKAENSRKFDESRLLCPYCNQEYPEDRKEQIVNDFESKRVSEMERINQRGQELKKKIASEEETIKKDVALLAKYNSEVETIRISISNLEDDLGMIPISVDLSGDQEYEKLKMELTEKEKFLESGSSAEQSRSELKNRRYEIASKLDDINRRIARVSLNEEIDSRISELVKLQSTTAQQMADEERKLDLLDRFNVKKMEMLTEAVNGNFSMVKFLLFERQINGSYKDVCKVLVDGSSYDDGLNHGHRILVDIDILNTFQRMNDVQLPIVIDDSESVDEWRIPVLETQVIVLRRTDDERMVIQ